MLPPRDTLEWITGSRLRATWIRTIVGLPDRGVWTRELYRGMRSMSVAHATVVKIEQLGLIKRVPKGGYGYYEVDLGHPLVMALHELVRACDTTDARIEARRWSNAVSVAQRLERRGEPAAPVCEHGTGPLVH